MDLQHLHPREFLRPLRPARPVIYHPVRANPQVKARGLALALWGPHQVVNHPLLSRHLRLLNLVLGVPPRH